MWRLRFFLKRLKMWSGYIFAASKVFKVEGITLAASSPYHYAIARSQSDGTWYESARLKTWIEKAKSLPPGATVFDVGGFNGIYGLTAALANPKAKVFIFEPDPVNARHIEKNTRINNLENCTLVEAAVSDKNGEIAFSGDGSTGSKVQTWGKPVKSITLASYGSPELLKIDVEGHEPQALKGADLSRTRTVFIEVNAHETLERLTAFRLVSREGENALLER